MEPSWGWMPRGVLPRLSAKLLHRRPLAPHRVSAVVEQTGLRKPYIDTGTGVAGLLRVNRYTYRCLITEICFKSSWRFLLWPLRGDDQRNDLLDHCWEDSAIRDWFDPILACTARQAPPFESIGLLKRGRAACRLSGDLQSSPISAFRNLQSCTFYCSNCKPEIEPAVGQGAGHCAEVFLQSIQPCASLWTGSWEGVRREVELL